MNFNWISLNNPVALWWIFLCLASLVNIIAWSWTKLYLYKESSLSKFSLFKLNSNNMIWFSSLYVFGCAYRSVFPKADVQRICLFDTWLSSVFLGRTVATFAEIAFVAQWAIVLKFLAQETNNHTTKIISQLIIPLIVIAEVFSWYAVISTNYFGNMIEESLWAITYALIAISLVLLLKYFTGAFKLALKIASICALIYVGFMAFIDVPMYYNRWSLDSLNQKNYFDLFTGLKDLNSRWIVTYDIGDWREEIPWMSLYFSFAVLVSIILCYVPLTSKNLEKHLKKIN